MKLLLKRHFGIPKVIFLVILLSGLGCCVIGLAGCAKKNIKNIDSRGKNIICFGDSLTYGYGAEEGQDFPALLSGMVEIPVINAGIDGDNTKEALRRLDDDVLSRNPLLVIVEFGGNDFLTKVPLGETVKNLEVIIGKVQTQGAMVAIADIGLSAVMGSYRKEFKRLSKKYNTIFIPRLLDDILTDPLLKSDFIHPNAAGYKIIAQKIYRTILPYLDENVFLRNYKK
jgi:acyl-CoA thioesterase-1